MTEEMTSVQSIVNRQSSILQIKRLSLFLLCFLLIGIAAVAQEKKRKKPVSPAYKEKKAKEDAKFLNKQWWLGLKAGANLSKVSLEKSYSAVAPTNYEFSTIAKQYKNYDLVGSHVALEVTFYFKGFSFSLQPTYQHARFMYTNTYEWTSSTETTNHVELNFEQEQKVDHAIIPLVVKYDITGNKLRPYVQIGVYTAMLVNASKEVSIKGIDNAAGGVNEFTNESIIVGAKDLFAKNHWGLMGGVGVNYNLGNNVRLNLDVMYRHGMSNIVSTKNRYDSDRLSGVGDVLDDLTLDNINFSVGCLFPLRFLSSGFKTLDLK
jgi:outer membrane protein W